MAALGAVLFATLAAPSRHRPAEPGALAPVSLHQLSRALFSHYLLPFQIIGLLLLVRHRRHCPRGGRSAPEEER